MPAVSMYRWQLEALVRMHNGCVLTGEPGKSVGAGKSRTAIAYWWTRVCGGGLNFQNGKLTKIKKRVDLVIITTARKRDTTEWWKDIAPFGVTFDPKLNPLGVTLEIDSWNNISKYTKRKGQFFIFDEQKALGGGVWGKSLVKIAKNNQWIMLTGTPGDVWMDYCQVFVANGYYKNRTEFIQTHVVYDRWAKFPKISGYRAVRRLETNRNRMLVIMNAEKLAERHVEWVSYPYDTDLYERVQNRRADPETGEPYRNASELCNALRLYSGASEGHSERFLELVKDRQRVIVFYNRNWELERLRDLGRSVDVPVYELNGHKHDDVPSDGRWWYLVQYAAGAEAWNCVTTDCMVFWSASYSWKQMEQAYGRIDRINTPYSDLYYFVMTNDSSIEKSVRSAIGRKEVFNERAFVGV